MFQKGTRDQFLTAAGVPYGFLNFEGYESSFILTIENGQAILKYAVEKKILTADEAAGIELEMQSHGILSDFAAVVAKVKSVEIPSELIGDWDFELCTHCGDAVVHGYVHHDGKAAGTPYMWLWALLDDLRKNVREGVLNTNEAILVFQKATSLNLPNTEDEAKAKFDALPDEVKDRMLGRSRLVSLLGALLGDEMPSILMDVIVVGNRGRERKPADEKKGEGEAPGDGADASAT